MQLKALVAQYAEALSDVSDSARTDAECLVLAWLNKSRSFLYAYPEYEIMPDAMLKQWLQRRQAGEPVAYIVGCKEFWSLPFKVTPDVLIPRADTECLVEWIVQQFKQPIRCADLGTGSGAIACALAHENPDWHIDATDQSSAALVIAQHNAEQLQLPHVRFYQGSWCDALPDVLYDLMVSNPPYIAEDDDALEAKVRAYEPLSALIADDNGLVDIKTIAQQAQQYLKPGGLLVLEHGYQQAKAVTDILQQFGYQNVSTHTDLNGLPRFTVAVR